MYFGRCLFRDCKNKKSEYLKPIFCKISKNITVKEFKTIIKKWIVKKVKEQFNWEKIAQDTHFAYEKAICQTMAERQAKQMLQEKARKTEKAENSQKEITNLLSFKKKHAYA